MKLAGIVVGVVGLAWLLLALGMDTTIVSSNGTQVYNLGLLDARRTQLTMGAVVLVVGVLLLLLARRSPKAAATGEAAGRPAPGAERIADLQALVADRGKTGIQIDTSDARTILGTTAGSPARAAGIQAGDRIVLIDDAPCDGDFMATTLKLTGERGTGVKVTVRRADQALAFDLIRQ